MRKQLILFPVVVLIATQAFCQSRFWTQVGIRSLQYKIRSVQDSERVDCLNTLAKMATEYDIPWLQTIDTICTIAWEANREAAKIGYKRGLAYSFLRLAENIEDKNDFYSDLHKGKYNPALFHKEKYYTRTAIKIGEDLGDYSLLGHSWYQMASMASNKGDWRLYDKAVEKASFYLKSCKPKQDHYRDEGYVKGPGLVGNEVWLAHLFRMKMFVAIWKNQLKDILVFADTAIQFLSKANRKSLLADTYNRLSYQSFRALDHKTSIESAKKAVSLYQSQGQGQRAVAAVTELCKMYEITGEFEEGLAYGKENIQRIEQLINQKGKGKKNFFSSGNAFFWMCRLYKLAGDFETAHSWIKKAKEYYPNPMDSVNMELWESEMGDVYRMRGNFDSAIHYLTPFFSRTDRHNFGKVALGYLYLDLEKYDSALLTALPVITLYHDRKREVPPLANALIIAAKAELAKGNPSIALNFARDGLRTVNLMQGRVLKIDILKLLSDIFMAMSRSDSAYYYMQEYTLQKDSIINRQFYWNLSNYKKEADDASQVTQFNLLSKNNELKNQRLKQTRLLLLLGLIGIGITAVFIYRSLSMKRKNDKLVFEKAQSQLQQKASDLEMQALRAQMNPHFIFNCLSSINRFILKNETEAASDYLTKFSRLIRMVLIHSQSSEVLLKDEIEMLRLYLDMEQLRFKNSFDYSINFTNSIDPEIIFIPPLLLQPFCENAIWHGLMHKKDQGYLEIKLALNGVHLNCTISDNGIGRKKAAEIKSRSGEMHKSVGLKITVERLSLMNKEDHSSTSYYAEDIMDENGKVAGTRVVLNINCMDKDKELVKLTAR